MRAAWCFPTWREWWGPCSGTSGTTRRLFEGHCKALPEGRHLPLSTSVSVSTHAHPPRAHPLTGPLTDPPCLTRPSHRPAFIKGIKPCPDGEGELRERWGAHAPGMCLPSPLPGPCLEVSQARVLCVFLTSFLSASMPEHTGTDSHFHGLP